MKTLEHYWTIAEGMNYYLVHYSVTDRMYRVREAYIGESIDDVMVNPVVITARYDRANEAFAHKLVAEWIGCSTIKEDHRPKIRKFIRISIAVVLTLMLLFFAIMEMQGQVMPSRPEPVHIDHELPQVERRDCLDQVVELEAKNITVDYLRTLLNSASVRNGCPVDLAYLPKQTDPINITFDRRRRTVREILAITLHGTGLNYRVRGVGETQYIAIVKL